MSSLLDRLEHRFGRFAIPGLIRYVVAFNALVYLLVKYNPALLEALMLWPAAVLHGEVWRLATYILIPQFGSGILLPEPISVVLYLWFLWWVGDSLEAAWGSFRLNLYYLTGMLGITVATFFFASYYSNALLNASLLFALAHFAPDDVIFIMYIIPAKIKWIAWFTAGLLLFGVIGAGFGSILGLAVALGNYVLFFGPGIVRGARDRQQYAERRRKFELGKQPDEAAMHRCAVCQRTELTHPDLEFRVAKDGEEYCLEHLPKPVPAKA